MASEASTATGVASCPDLLEDIFEVGVWNQHLQDQSNRMAPVQGVRFYFLPPTLPDAQPEEQEEREEQDLIRGKLGYVCALANITQLDGDQTLRIGLENLKPALQAGKAWESNRKAFRGLCGRVVPVIYMTTGRPKDRRFGAQDALLGLFEVKEADENVLSCILMPASSPLGTITAGMSQQQLQKLLPSASRGSKRRRRELPVYSCVGGHTGAPLSSATPLAHSGAQCKDLWIRTIQAAAGSVDVNAYCISDPDVLEELRHAAARGIVVRVRYDSRQQSKTVGAGVGFEEQRYRNVQVHPVIVSEDERCLMHKKELIVDARCPGACAVLGSYNPTSNARTNQESVILCADPVAVSELSDRFQYDWAIEEENRARSQNEGSVVFQGHSETP